MINIGNDPDDITPSVNRVTFRGVIVRERSGEQPNQFPINEYLGGTLQVTHFESAFILPDKRLSGSDAPFKIDTSWITSPCVISVLNKTRWVAPVQPTKAQAAEIAESVVLIGFSKTSFPLRISPKMTQPLFVSPGVEVYVKALNKSAVISIFVT